MASIDKLLIQGIRSFSPQQVKTITFYKPLTIIVGTNGAGKTTIIECLRYATSGEMPPNSKKNHSFIHDPKVAGQTQVDAKISLRFTNVAGRRVQATQLLKLTQKESKMEFKRVDSTLMTWDEHGQKHTQSHRCAEFDRLVPELMGVSSAVLESVIFCHQEDSNWPLMEPTKLKTRFDNIFSASRYRTALDSIKKQKKEYTATAKDKKADLEVQKEKRKRVLQLRQEYTAVTTKIKCSNEEIAKLSEDLGEVKKVIDEFEAREQQNRDSRTRAEQLSAEIAVLTDKNKEFFASLAEAFIESAEELHQLRSHSEEKREEMNVDVRKIEESITDAGRAIVDIGGRIAKLESSYDDVERRRKERLDLQNRMQGVVTRLVSAFQGLEGPKKLTDQAISTFTTSASKYVARLGDRYHEEVANHTEMIRVLSADVTQIGERIAGEKATKVERERNVKQSEERLRALQSTERDLAEKLGATNDIEKRLASSEEKLSATDVKALHARRERAQDLVKKHTEAVEKWSNVLSEMSEFAASHAKLEIKLKDLEQQRREAKDHMAAVCVQFSDLEMGAAPDTGDPRHCLSELEVVSKKLEDELQSASKQLESCRSAHAQAKARLGSISTGMAQKLKNVEKLAGTLTKAGVSLEDDINEKISQLESELQSLHKKMSTANASQVMYEKFVDLAMKQESCPLCERALAGDDLAMFVDRLSGAMEHVPDELKQYKEEIDRSERQLSLLKKHRAAWERHDRLRAEINDHHSQKEEAEEGVRAAAMESEAISKSCTALRAKKDGLLQILTQMKGCASAWDRVLSLEAEVKDLQMGMQDSSGAGVTLEHAKEQCQHAKEGLSHHKKELDAIDQELDGVKDLEMQCMRLRQQLQDVLSSRKELDSVAEQRLEAEKSLEESRQVVQSLLSSMSSLETEYQKRKKQLADFRQEADRADQATMLQLNEAKEHLSSLMSLKEALGQRSEAKLSKEMDVIKKQKRQSQEDLKKLSQKELSLKQERDGLVKKLAEFDMTLRNLDDNIKHRNQEKEIKNKEAELAQLLDTLGPIHEGSNVKEARNRHSNLKTKIDTLEGKRSELAAHARDLKRRMAASEFKTADKDYRDALIAMKTTEMVREDLEKYYKAVDCALMRYHAMKMEEINRIIKELWQATYSGSDIDTIEIRSDVTEVKNRRSYDYRVVMVKQGVELDMRGRCSAGQKVLCSLIIRLALAETFCLNCGIIALDEPTTNLDRANVEAFAHALVNIINMRRQQRSFQLIVITHDEDFVQLLGRSEHADYYWRVTKDERGHSTIDREVISSLG